MSSFIALQTSPSGCPSSILVSIDLILSEHAGVRASNKVLHRLTYHAQSWIVLHNPRIAWQRKDSHIALRNARIVCKFLLRAEHIYSIAYVSYLQILRYRA